MGQNSSERDNRRRSQQKGTGTLQRRLRRTKICWDRTDGDSTKHFFEHGDSTLFQVTICHYDILETLQEKGGWLNPNIVDWYTDYAQICFENYGDIVTRRFPHLPKYAALNYRCL